MPNRQHHLCPPCRRNITKVKDIVPTKLTQQFRHLRFRLRIISREKHRVVAITYRLGFTISAAVMALSVLTSRTFGNARCRISPSESVSFTNKVSGKPRLKSMGLEISISVLPPKTRFVGTLQLHDRRQGFTKLQDEIAIYQDCKVRLPVLKPCLSFRNAEQAKQNAAYQSRIAGLRGDMRMLWAA